MSRKLRYALFFALVCVLLIASFVAGVYRGRANVAETANGAMTYAQTGLGLMHLHQYQELESDLSKGCVNEALEKLHVRVNSQMVVLANMHRYEPKIVEDVLKRRAPDLLAHLPQFESKYGNSWIEPKCKK